MALAQSHPSCAAAAAARKYGTPCFYFDVMRFRSRIGRLRSSLPEGVGICFSVKSNPFLARYGAAAADSVEVCSPGEWELCVRQGIPPNRIVVNGVYKSPQELSWLAEAGPARISIESVRQYRLLADSARKCQNVLLRLTSGNQFGMNLEEIQDIVRHPHPYIAVRGLHFYSGTQKKEAAAIQKDLRLLWSALSECGLAAPEVSYGPGLGTPLFEGASMPYEAAYDAMLKEVRRLHSAYPVTLELGRLLTADCGLYVTRVVDKKRNGDRTFYIVDGGIHQLCYYGQINGVPAPVIHQMSGGAPSEATVCGALCTAGDILAKDVILREMEIGDCLIFGNAGAYSVTEARSLFLSRPLPAVIVSDNGKLVEIRESGSTSLLNMCNKRMDEVGSEAVQ